jgi:hypothetical protein
VGYENHPKDFDVPSGYSVGTNVIHRTRLDGDTYDRYQLLANGTTMRGDGVSAPVESSTGADLALTPVYATGVTATDTAAVEAALDDGNVLLVSRDGTPFRLNYIAIETSEDRGVYAVTPVQVIQMEPEGVFRFRGTWDLLGTINSFTTVTNADLVYPGESNPGSSNTTVSQLTMAATTTASRGDVVKIISDDMNPWARPASGGLGQRMGEYSTIGADVAGTTVNLTNVLIEAYTTAIKLVRPDDVRFQVRGPITFDTDEDIRDEEVYSAVIELRGGKHSFIGDGVRIHNSNGRGIANFGYCTHIDGVQFRNLANRISLSQYGYAIHDGGWQTLVTGCHFERCRHGYTESGETEATGSTSYEYHGGGFFSVVANCTAQAVEGQAFDTHGSAYRVTFNGCKVTGDFVGVSSGGQAFVARGRYTRFENCHADNCFRGMSLGGLGSEAINCTVRNSRYVALDLGVDTADASDQTTQGGHLVQGGFYETRGAARTVTVAPAAGYIVTARMRDVTLHPISGTNGALVVECGGSAAISNTAGQRLYFKDLHVDLKDFGNAGSTQVIAAQSDNFTIRGNGLFVDGVGTTATAITLLGFSVAGSGADIEVKNMEYFGGATTTAPTPIHASMTLTRASWHMEYGGYDSYPENAWSDGVGITAASSVSLAPISQRMDRVFCLYLSGSAGDVTTGNLPTTGLGLRDNGRFLLIVNASNGIVTVNSTAIVAGGEQWFIYIAGSWRAVVNA